MKLLLLTGALSVFAFAQPAQAATGVLIQVNGVDVSGTTENVWYLSEGRYTLLTSVAVNTTVPYAPYAYTALFYLPNNIPTNYVVVTNQAGTAQSGFSLQQVSPVGTQDPATGSAPYPPSGSVGGTLMNISSSDVGGTTEYVWSNVNGNISLLGSGAVNTNPSYGPFAYNVLFYLPPGVAQDAVFVTNQAGSPQQGYVIQQARPLGTIAAAAPAARVSKIVGPSAQGVVRDGQMMRAAGSDVSGTTEYVWYRLGTVYTLLGTSRANATDPRNQYRYNVLFFLAKGQFARNVVVTNQAGIIQRGAILDAKRPTVVAAGG